MNLKHQPGGVVADRLVRLPEVRHLTGLGKSSIYEGLKAGTFPQAVRVTDYAVAWRQSEIDRWIASRPPAAARPETAPDRAPAKPRSSPKAATAKRPAPKARKARS